MCTAIGAGFELCISNAGPGRRHDKRGVIGMSFGMETRVHIRTIAFDKGISGEGQFAGVVHHDPLLIAV